MLYWNTHLSVCYKPSATFVRLSNAHILLCIRSNPFLPFLALYLSHHSTLYVLTIWSYLLLQRCSGLNENDPHRRRNLNVFQLSNCLGRLRGVALLEEICHWEGSRFQKPTAGQVSLILLPAWGSGYELSTTASKSCPQASRHTPIMMLINPLKLQASPN